MMKRLSCQLFALFLVGLLGVQVSAQAEEPPPVRADAPTPGTAALEPAAPGPTTPTPATKPATQTAAGVPVAGPAAAKAANAAPTAGAPVPATKPAPVVSGNRPYPGRTLTPPKIPKNLEKRRRVRPSGFWTSTRPAKGGAYRYRLLGIGVVILLITGGGMLWVVRQYGRSAVD